MNGTNITIILRTLLNMKNKNPKLQINLEGKYDCELSESSQSSISTCTPTDLKVIDLNHKSRKRKNLQQMQILKVKFQENPKWDKEIIEEMSETAGLTQAQIYKWNWDRQKKIRANMRTENEAEVRCNESLQPFAIDKEMFVSQRWYKIDFSAHRL
jgi:hypothetical protein